MPHPPPTDCFQPKGRFKGKYYFPYNFRASLGTVLSIKGVFRTL